jgi:hypothetical protein
MDRQALRFAATLLFVGLLLSFGAASSGRSVEYLAANRGVANAGVRSPAFSLTYSALV